MSGVSFLADTNILIYIQNGDPSLEPYLDDVFFVSDISVLEYLGRKGITQKEIELKKLVLKAFHIIQFDKGIRDQAILLKQKYTIKIPDAIIAATALYFGYTLITADKDIKRIKELNLLIIEPSIL